MSSLSLANLKSGFVAYKWWVIATASALLLLLILAVLPLIISQQFQKWVLANGGDKVSVENVDFNPFTAKLGLYNIVIERSGNQPFLLPELQLHAQWRDLFSRRFVIKTVSVKGVHLTVDQSTIDQEHVGGILLKNLVSEKQPEDKVDDEPWTFSINDLQLESFNLLYRQPDIESSLQIESLSLAELDSHPEAGPATIRLKGTLDKAPLFVNGNMSVFSEALSFAGKIVLTGLNVSPYLQLASPDFKQNRLVMNVDSQLNLNHKQSTGLSIQHDGALSVEDILWSDPGAEIQAEKVSWKGAVDAGLPLNAAINIKTDGRLQADNLDINGREIDLQLTNEQFVWQGKADTNLSKSQDLKMLFNGQLLNRQLDLDLDSHNTTLKNGNFNWQGKADISQLSDSGWTVQSEGKLQNEMFNLERAQQEFQLETEILAWQGNLNLATGDDSLSIQSLSDLKLSQLKMQTLDERDRLLLSDTLQLEKVDIQALDNISINRLSFTDFSLGRPHQLDDLSVDLPGFINYDNLTVDELRYSAEQGIAIKRVVQDGVKHVVIRHASGEWGFDSFVGALQRMAGEQAPEADQPGQETAAAEQQQVAAADQEALPIRIGSIVINSGGVVYFIDQTQPKPFVQQIKIDSFTLDNIDSTKTDKGGKLSLRAKIDNSILSLDGNVFAFAQQQPSFDLKGEVQALSLLPYSIFIEKVVGYQVDSGSLNATTSLLASEGNLESTTDLTLHQLDIKALTAEQLQAIDGKLNSGLETGLSMLKDKNDTIKLNIPVNGSFDNLQVDPSDIINQALGTALKKGAKTYFAAALFPFGTLLVIADAASDQSMQVQLDPVFFTAGSSNMEQKYHAYLEKIAQVLDEKPEIHIKICGVAALEDSQVIEGQMREAFEAQQQALAAEKKLKAEQQSKADQARQPKPVFEVDRKKLEQQVSELAVIRAAAVTDYLLKSQDVEPKRLVHCQPRIELESAESKPRVDLLL